MSFHIPVYHHPDFTQKSFRTAPDVSVKEAVLDGVAPEYFHSTSKIGRAHV